MDLISLANASLRRQAIAEQALAELEALTHESDPRKLAQLQLQAAVIAASSAALLALALAEQEKRRKEAGASPVRRFRLWLAELIAG